LFTTSFEPRGGGARLRPGEATTTGVTTTAPPFVATSFYIICGCYRPELGMRTPSPSTSQLWPLTFWPQWPLRLPRVPTKKKKKNHEIEEKKTKYLLFCPPLL